MCDVTPLKMSMQTLTRCARCVLVTQQYRGTIKSSTLLYVHQQRIVCRMTPQNKDAHFYFYYLVSFGNVARYVATRQKENYF